MTTDTLTDAERDALARAGWTRDGPGFTANGVRLLRFRHEAHTRVMSAAEWRAEIKRMEERDDD